MRIPDNHILVKVDQELDDSHTYASGLTIYKDPSFQKEHHKRTWGTVKHVPDKLSSKEEIRRIEENILHSPTSYPLYEPKIFTYSDIEPIILPEDKVYFYYVYLDEYNFIEIDGENYYKMDYRSIICVVRDGKILPVGGHMLVEPYYGKGVDEESVEGETIRVKKLTSGIITEIVDKPLPTYGIVKHLSDPLKGDEIGFKLKDLILFREIANHLVTIENREYYAMYYWDALCLMDKEEI